MADLCLRQGHRDEALAIYRRLIARATDDAARARMSRRVAAIEGDADLDARAPKPAADREADRDGQDDGVLPVPGVRARVTGDELAIEWHLPTDTAAPALEVLLVKRGPDGVETETRAWSLDARAGRLVVTVPGLHSARAAAGSTGGGGFVPLARSR